MNKLFRTEQTAQRIEEPEIQVPLFIEGDSSEILFDESLDDL